MTLTGLADAQQNLIPQIGCYACLRLDNVGIHMYAKFDQHISCSLRVVRIFNNWYWADRHTDRLTQCLDCISRVVQSKKKKNNFLTAIED